MAATVAEGQWAILLLSSGEQRLVHVRRGSKLSVGRQQCKLDALVGAPFGANFRVEANSLVRDSRTTEEISGAIGDAFAGVVGAWIAEHKRGAEAAVADAVKYER